MAAKARLERWQNGVRFLVLDDPEKRNAIGPVMRKDLLAIADELRDDAGARCLVVTGEGSAFCAGADLVALFDHEGASTDQMRQRQLGYYESFLWIRDLPFPTVAAVDGHAIGAGLNLALACDIVIAGEGARFGLTFSRLGLHPGGGCTWFVTERLGRGRALRELLLGSVLRPDEAFRMGLADDRVDDARAAATELADHVATLHPALVRDMKRAVGVAAGADFATTVEVESWAQASSAQHPGVLAGIREAGRSTRD